MALEQVITLIANEIASSSVFLSPLMYIISLIPFMNIMFLQLFGEKLYPVILPEGFEFYVTYMYCVEAPCAT